MFGSNRTAFGGGSQPFGSTASPFASQPQPQATSTFGMGVTNNNAQSGFGGFGAANNAGTGTGGPTGSLFGMSANNTTQNSPFGNPIGAATTASSNLGTAVKPFQPYEEKDPTTGVQNVFETISAMPEYRNYSLEELRLQDYQQGRRLGQGTVTPFGTTTSTNSSNTNQGFGILGNTNQPQSAGSATGGLFGQRANTAQNSPFGSLSSGNDASATGTGPFGSTAAAGGNAFGGGGTGPFGSKPAGTAGGGLFGQNNRTSSGGLFGQNNSTFGQPQTSAFGSGAGTSAFGSKPAGTGLFGQNTVANQPFGSNAATGTGGGLFGQSNNTGMGNTGSGGGLFGQNNTAGSVFGQPNNQANTGGGLFGSKPAGGGLFGQPQNSTPFGGGGGATGGGGLFGQNNNQPSGGGLFGNTQSQAGGGGGGLFGQNNTQPSGGGLFGQNNAQPSGGGLFGQNNSQPSGGGLFGQNTSNPFGQPQQSNTGGGLFGSKPAGGGLFGQPQNSTPFGGGATNTGGGLFGQNSNQPSTGGGGLFGGTQNQGGGGLFGQNNNQPSTGGGLFGQNNNQPSTGGGLFGQNNNPPSTGGGLFGAKPVGGGGGLFGQNNNQPSTGGGLFGQNNNQPSTGGGLFGQNNNQPSAGGGLFGNKPAGTTGGGLFGNANSNTQSSLGQPSGGGLFGAKPASAGSTSSNTGGGLFGNTNNTSQPSGGGLFGNTTNTSQPSSGGGLFGNKPAGPLGSTNTNNTTGGLFGSANNNLQSGTAGTGATGAVGGGLFGNKPAGATGTSGGFGGGLFGNNNSNTSNALGGTTQSNTGFGGAGGGGGLFGNKPQQPATQQNDFLPQQQQLNQNQANNPYGTNELFSRVVVPSSITQPTKPSATKVNADIKKKASLTGAYRLAPRPLFTSKSLSGSSTPKLDSFSGTSTRSSSESSSPDSIGKELVPTSTGSTLFSPETDEAILSADKLLFNPDKKSFKNLVINKRKAGQSPAEDDGEVKKITLQSTSSVDSTSVNKGLNESAAFGEVLDSPTVGKDFGVSRDRLSISPARNHSPESEESVSDRNVKTRGIIGEDVSFTDNGYYISPSFETLSTKSLPQLRKLSGLVIGHKNYGKIEFLEPVDLSNVPLALLCGNIIIFEPKSCFVYPYSSTVPGPGEGINVRARISCYKCYPADKATRAPIKDANHQLVKRHIEKLKKLPNTKFDSYDPVTGCYRFVVEHPITS